MTLDIRGGIKNTKINNNPFIVIDELLSNAIDSYLIRKNEEPAIEGLNVDFVIELFPRQLDGSKLEFKITCTDNGAGFGDEQVTAFVTKDTSYKDDLSIAGISKCRGSGRIQYLHYFRKMQIESIFKSNDKINKRTLSIEIPSTKSIDENSFLCSEEDQGSSIKTTVTLDIIKPEIYKRFFEDKNLREMFSSDSLRNYVMISFLQRFVSLKTNLSNFQINFKTIYQTLEESSSLTSTDIPSVTATKEIAVNYQDANGQNTEKVEQFLISHYKLSKSNYKLQKNLVALCAKSSVVKGITSRFLKTKTIQNNDIQGFYHIILIESLYLDEHVNVQRDDFDIPLDFQQSDLYMQNLISLEQIHDSLDEIIHEMLTPPDWDREKIIKDVTQKYGITSNMIADANVRVHYGDTKEKVAKRVLSAFQDQILKDTSEIFDIKQEISNTDPTTKEFREKINSLAWKYTSSLKKMDMANLSQVIVRRAAILEILGLSIGKNLLMQVENKGIRCDEKIIHNIFFPMGKDVFDVEDHDIWLLSEEYQYFDYICSDKQLSKIKWDENSFLFDSDIDDEMQKLLKKNYEDNTAKRPDIAVFNKEGSVIIIEFKAPDISLDDHVGDLMEYAQLLTAKSKGKLKKVYGYLLGTAVNPNRIMHYTKFPSGTGWFNTTPIMEHNTGVRLGELYSEILFYDDIVTRANKRLEVYQKRLNINLN